LVSLSAFVVIWFLRNKNKKMTKGATENFIKSEAYIQVMKNVKKMGIVLSTLLFLALLPNATAAASDTLTITITVNYLDVTLYQDDGSTPYTTWAIGSGKLPSSENIMGNTDCIAVKNTGNCACDFKLIISGEAANWTNADDVVGADIYVLMGIFCLNNTASVAAGNFLEANDHINDANITATADLFSGDSDGANVAANAVVYLYLDLLAPSSQSASHGEQTITVTVWATTAA
jgi:hypothetical protein